jgi:uncharacterized protein
MRQNSAMEITSTPCQSICQIDHLSGLCIGCGRSAQEIAAWAALSEPERLAIMARLPTRFADMPALAAARTAFDAARASRPRTGRRRTR